MWTKCTLSNLANWNISQNYEYIQSKGPDEVRLLLARFELRMSGQFGAVTSNGTEFLDLGFSSRNTHSSKFTVCFMCLVSILISTDVFSITEIVYLFS
jgi:hypothetical protein